jgi:WD40 repeat protein
MHSTRVTALPFLAFLLFQVAGGTRAQPTQPDVLTRLKGHTDTIEAVTFSPDCKFLATASFDKTVRLFDPASGKELRAYAGEQGHKGQVLCAAFSAQGDLLATGATDNTLRIWEVPVSTPVKTFTTASAATGVLVARDGKTFVVAGADGVVKILPSGEEKGAIELKGHKGAVTHLGLSGTTWITTGADKTIRFWDAAGKQVAIRHAGDVAALATNTNNPTAWVLTASGRVQAWTVLPQATIPPQITAIAPKITAAAYDAAMKQNLPVPGFPAREWSAGGKVAGLVLSPDNQRVVTIGPGAECVSWLAGDGKKEKAFATGGNATVAAFTKDGQRIAVAGTDGSVKLYTVGDGKLAAEFKATGPVSDLAFHPTKAQLVGVVKNAAVAWNVAFQPGQDRSPSFGSVMQSFPHPKAFGSPAFLADGQFLTAGEDKLVRRFRIASDVPAKTLQHPNLVDCAAFDDTGERLATGCHDGSLRIWDVPKGAVAKEVKAHVVTTPQPMQNPIYAVVWTRDHKQVFTASFDKTIKLWDAADGKLVREFKADPGPKSILPKKEEPKKDEPKKDDKKDEKKDAKKDDKKDEKKDPPKKVEEEKPPFGHRDQVFSIALSKDGKFLASASSDKTLKLWDVATGRVIREFPNPDLKPLFPDEPAPSHPGWVQVVRFTPDEKFLVTAGPAPRGRSYLAVWNVADGKRVYGAEREFGPIHSLAVTADGTRLVLGCAAPKGKSEPDAVIVKLPGK